MKEQSCATPQSWDNLLSTASFHTEVHETKQMKYKNLFKR